MAPEVPDRHEKRRGSQQHPQSPLVILCTGLLGLLLALGWVLWSAGRNQMFDGRGGLSPLLKISRDIPSGGRFPGDPYVGPRSCAECHPGEYATFTKSGHARTMRMASERQLSNWLAGQSVADPERPDLRWMYAKQNGEFIIKRQEGAKVDRFVVDYALGSGHRATTFVSVLNLDPPKILEHRLTYYTRHGTLEVTPGQAVGEEMPGTTPYGRELPAQGSLKCLGCHATQLSAHSVARLEPLSMIPSVTCERCHGPGRVHVEAARRGAEAKDLSMPMGLNGWSAQSQLDFCGSCHRHPSRVPPEELKAEDPTLARFQPIGLSQSRCFVKSAGTLSCVSCHDPHSQASPDPATYERVCLNCHEMPRQGTTRVIGHEISHQAKRLVCPVSPSKGCVVCHMPGVDSGQHVLFTDHWIRVHRSTPGL